MRFARFGLAAALPFLLATTLVAQSLEVQLQRAVQREMATGDTKAAIAEYRRIADRAGANKVVAAQAMLRLAEAYAKQGDAQARTVYEQIVARYADQTEVVAAARSRLGTSRPQPFGAAIRRRVWTGPEIEQQVRGRVRVSPDGRFLAFAANSWNDLIVREITTGAQRVLVHNLSGEISNPVWSADGKRIAFQFESHNAGEVRIVNVDGGGLRTAMPTPRDLEWFTIQAWSPDGTRILVETSVNDDDQFQLFWLNVASGTRTPLTENTYSGNISTAISPDGRYVAFGGVGIASSDRATRKSGHHIRVIGSDGSDDHVLSDNRSDLFPVSWTANGNGLLVLSKRGNTLDLWAFDVINGRGRGEPRLIERDLCQCGQLIAAQPDAIPATMLGATAAGAVFFAIRPNISDIYIASLGPLGKAALSVPLSVSRRGHNVWPQWSPDSKRLLFYWSTPTIREFSVFSPTTGIEQRLTGVPLEPGGFCWSGTDAAMMKRRDGERIPFVRVDLITRAETVVFAEPAGDFGAVTCTADGRFIAYRVGPTAVVRVRDTATGTVKDIESPVQPLSSGFPISPNGQQIAFFGRRLNEPLSSLFVMSIAGDAPRELVRLTAPDEFMTTWGIAWSHDSRHIYFSRRSRGGREQNGDDVPFNVYRVPATGGEEESVGLEGRDLRDLNVSSDGSRIAFSVGALNRPEIWAIENTSAVTK
jgi:Tol biopolymer transport system component